VAHLCTDDDHHTALYAYSIVGGILSHLGSAANARERNNSWITLAARVLGVAEHDLRCDIADGGDSVLLAILIRVARQYNRSCMVVRVVLETLCKLDISKTPPSLQHDFCTFPSKHVKEGGNWSFFFILKINKYTNLYPARVQLGTEADTYTTYYVWACTFEKETSKTWLWAACGHSVGWS
jgi:hypothetical protein